MLKDTNIGRFGYGVDVKIGSNFTSLTPTNYDYRRDPYDLRWKHIDEFYGKVNRGAIDTTNFRYYFYTNYYTYTSDSKFQIDKKSRDFQSGEECYSYIHTKSELIQRKTSCTKFKEPFTITQTKFTGMMIGLTLAGLFLGVMCFGGLEIARV